MPDPGGSTPYIEFSHRKLYTIARKNDWKVERCMQALIAAHSDLNSAHQEKLKAYLQKTFLSDVLKRWQQAHRCRKKFEKNFDSWLATKFIVSDREQINGAQKRTPGRPQKHFEECSGRSQRRKVKEVREILSPDLLRRAALPVQQGFGPEAALALMLNNSLSKAQYEDIRLAAKAIGHDIYPPYNLVRDAKTKCYPKKIDVSENVCSIDTLSLLSHTANRIMSSLADSAFKDADRDLKLVVKWGCDGSSGHSEYKQTFTNATTSDTNIFLTSLVPLQIQSSHDPDQIYWENPRPSSTRYCRPLRFEFIKESSSVIKAEVSRVEDEIKKFQPTRVTVNGRDFYFDFEMILSMIDGKVLQTINDTPYMLKCSICGAVPHEMNDLDVVYSKPTPARYMSMSPLHARIKFMECLLKIAYNLATKEWKACTPELKAARADAKKKIQTKFREQLGLQIDVVKQGAGNSNDGNTSRRFFADPSTAASITGLDRDLIQRFGTIVDTINSNSQTNVDKFAAYCLETARRYVKLYPWYPMSNTVHKVLVHGSRMIADASLPIGLFSEEAQEAQNKVYRQQRLAHTRKTSRLLTNTDIIHIMLALSDPYISKLRRDAKTSDSQVNSDVLSLLELSED